MIIDAQLHEPVVQLDWAQADDLVKQRLLTELQLGWMTAVGVDAALLFPVDLNWALGAATEFPQRFAVVPMIVAGGMHGHLDPSVPDIEQRILDMYRIPAVVGFRMVVATGRGLRFDSSGSAPADPSEDDPNDLSFARLRSGFFDGALNVCESERIPVFVNTTSDLAAAGEVAARFPDLTLIIDHLGIRQPPLWARESPPLRSLPALLELARHPNILVKVSGAPALSQEKYPFADLWKPIRSLVDSFGPQRLMWGTDASRFQGRIGFHVSLADPDEPYEGKHSYAEAVLAFRSMQVLSEEERRLLMGDTLRQVLSWPDEKSD